MDVDLDDGMVRIRDFVAEDIGLDGVVGQHDPQHPSHSDDDSHCSDRRPQPSRMVAATVARREVCHGANCRSRRGEGNVAVAAL